MATAPTMAKSNFGRLAGRYRDAYGVAAGTAGASVPVVGQIFGRGGDGLVRRRTPALKAGNYLIARPGWDGAVPADI